MKMMKTIQTAAIAMAIAFSAASVTTPVAAQDADKQQVAAVVMIVDFDGIMREASAMQDMAKQIKKRQEGYQQEIEKRQQALRQEEQQIAQQRTLLGLLLLLCHQHG